MLLISGLVEPSLAVGLVPRITTRLVATHNYPSTNESGDGLTHRVVLSITYLTAHALEAVRVIRHVSAETRTAAQVRHPQPLPDLRQGLDLLFKLFPDKEFLARRHAGFPAR